ncbi:MAG: zinc metallopeptidase [Clostridia bacterium]|nr:zinc metallopeptidase [Clostridia bacterium]
MLRYYLGYLPKDGSELYIILLIAVLLFSLIAQIKVKNTFEKYNRIPNSRGMTGAEAAYRILEANGIHDVHITSIPGELTDHYDPKNNMIYLSEAVYSSTGIAAVGVASHEAGHAVQYATGYDPIKLRSAIVGITQFASAASIGIFMLGLVFSFSFLVQIGFILYAIVAFFQFITLPVEFNASSRASAALEGILEPSECRGVKKVLFAAAMTYVAALASALVQLFRLYLLMGGGGRRRR